MRGRASRIACVAAIGGTLIGCLFPSFENLERSNDATSTKPKTKATDAATDPSDGEETPSTTPPPTPIPPPTGAIDAGPDVVRGAPVVICEGNPCNAGPTTMCCSNQDTPACLTGSNADCAAQAFDGNGRAFRCDGTEDCPVGQVCCFINSQEHGAICEATCGGQILCHADEECPNHGPCNGAVFGAFSFCH